MSASKCKIAKLALTLGVFFVRVVIHRHCAVGGFSRGNWWSWSAVIDRLVFRQLEVDRRRAGGLADRRCLLLGPFSRRLIDADFRAPPTWSGVR